MKLIYHSTAGSPLGMLSTAARMRLNGGVSNRTLDCYALVYLIRGRCRFDSAPSGKRAVAAGEGFLLFPGVKHTYRPYDGKHWDDIYLLFEGPVFDLWRRTGLIVPEHPFFKLHPVEVWVPRIESVCQHVRDALDAVCRLQALFADIAQAQHTTEAAAVDHVSWLENARHHLRRHALQADAVQQTAREMGLSYERFRKRFRQAQSASPGRYIAGHLVEEACRRLLAEATPIKQIADELGFCDEFHFSRRFRQFTGLSPAAYRNRLFGD